MTTSSDRLTDLQGRCMTNNQPQDDLVAIRAILTEVAQSQQRTQERLDQMAESQQRSQERHDAEVAEIRALQRDNAAGIAELREAQQANLMAIAETRQQLQASIGDVVHMISQQSDVIKEERDETIAVEVDTLNALSDLKEGQENLITYVRRGFDILGQSLVELREEMQAGFNGMSALLQSLIDEVKLSTGRITRLENKE